MSDVENAPERPDPHPDDLNQNAPPPADTPDSAPGDDSEGRSEDKAE
jgi:hypothetical protein